MSITASRNRIPRFVTFCTSSSSSSPFLMQRERFMLPRLQALGTAGAAARRRDSLPRYSQGPDGIFCIDGIEKECARIAALPCCRAEVVPEVSGIDALPYRSVPWIDQVIGEAMLQAAEEPGVETNREVEILKSALSFCSDKVHDIGMGTGQAPPCLAPRRLPPCFTAVVASSKTRMNGSGPLAARRSRRRDRHPGRRREKENPVPPPLW